MRLSTNLSDEWTDGVLASERWRQMDEIVEWYRFAQIVRGVTSKGETIPLLIGGRW